MTAWFSWRRPRKAPVEAGSPPTVAPADVEARLSAVESLLRVAEPQALAALVAALDDPEERVREAAARGLEHPETPAFEAMLDAARADTAQAVLARGDGAHTDAQPRIFSLAATLGADEGVDRLAAMLRGDDTAVRRTVIAALSWPLRHGRPDVRQRLVLAARPLLGDDDPEIVLDAAIVLAIDADDSRARNLLLELAHAATAAAEGVLSGARAEVSKATRLAAIRAIGRLPDAATRAVLLATLRDLDGEVRGAACDALATRGDARTADVLLRLETSDADPLVRERARAAALEIRARYGR